MVGSFYLLLRCITEFGFG